MSIITLTTDNWEETVTRLDKPVIVEFWADWCQPCRQMKMVLDEMDEEFSETLTICKVDVDAEVHLRYDINSIPHIRIFNGGEHVGDVNGAMPKPALVEELKKFIEF